VNNADARRISQWMATCDIGTNDVALDVGSGQNEHASDAIRRDQIAGRRAGSGC
jgi:hypothetical protein